MSCDNCKNHQKACYFYGKYNDDGTVPISPFPPVLVRIEDIPYDEILFLPVRAVCVVCEKELQEQFGPLSCMDDPASSIPLSKRRNITVVSSRTKLSLDELY